MRHLYVPKPALSREGRAKAAKATRAEQDVQQQDVQQQDQSSLRRWLGRGLRAMKAALPAPAQRLLLTRPTIEQQERPPSPASEDPKIKMRRVEAQIRQRNWELQQQLIEERWEPKFQAALLMAKDPQFAPPPRPAWRLRQQQEAEARITLAYGGRDMSMLPVVGEPEASCHAREQQQRATAAAAGGAQQAAHGALGSASGPAAAQATPATAPRTDLAAELAAAAPPAAAPGTEEQEGSKAPVVSPAAAAPAPAAGVDSTAAAAAAAAAPPVSAPAAAFLSAISAASYGSISHEIEEEPSFALGHMASPAFSAPGAVATGGSSHVHGIAGAAASGSATNSPAATPVPLKAGGGGGGRHYAFGSPHPSAPRTAPPPDLTPFGDRIDPFATFSDHAQFAPDPDSTLHEPWQGRAAGDDASHRYDSQAGDEEDLCKSMFWHFWELWTLVEKQGGARAFQGLACLRLLAAEYPEVGAVPPEPFQWAEPWFQQQQQQQGHVAAPRTAASQPAEAAPEPEQEQESPVRSPSRSVTVERA